MSIVKNGPGTSGIFWGIGVIFPNKLSLLHCHCLTAVQSGQMAIRDTNGVGTFFGGYGMGLLSDS